VKGARDEPARQGIGRRSTPVDQPPDPHRRALTRWPESGEILVRAGLAPLADPGHRELVKDLPVTLEMACVNHGLDLGDLVRRLSVAAGVGR
jgi:hypothetical protein